MPTQQGQSKKGWIVVAFGQEIGMSDPIPKFDARERSVWFHVSL